MKETKIERYKSFKDYRDGYQKGYKDGVDSYAFHAELMKAQAEKTEIMAHINDKDVLIVETNPAHVKYIEVNGEGRVKHFFKWLGGEWIDSADGGYKCKHCGYKAPYDSELDDYYFSCFCPNCGDHMKNGEGRENE